tara:strand:- start:70 stop:609 length:540 start_codon:yes stop_codon:yes gene_type:complete
MRRKRRFSAFGAALAATNDLFDSIGDELGLPLDREEWDADDYEDERDAIGRRLVEIAGGMAGLRGKLRKEKGLRKRLAHAASREQARAIRAERQLPYREGFDGDKVRSQLSEGLVLESKQGKEAFVVPLESGVYLVAEGDSHILRTAHPRRIAKALQESAKTKLLAPPGRAVRHWTSEL